MNENARIELIYRLHGEAMHAAQALEYMLVTLLFISRRIELPKQEWQAKWESVLADLEKCQLGTLIRDVTKAEPPAHIVVRLEAANRRRKFLVHHFFRQRHDALKMVDDDLVPDELREIAYYLKGTAQTVAFLVNDARSKAGLPMLDEPWDEWAP